MTGQGRFVLLSALPCTSGLRIKSAMTCCRARPAPPCGYCLKASMTDLAVVLSCFTLTLVLSHQGRWGIWLVVLLLPRTPCRPVVSRLRGNEGEGRQYDGSGVDLPSPSPLIPLPSRERGIGWLVVLSCFARITLPPCGYCLKASMTGLAVGLS